jgi:predicted RNA-binding Zn-ribbon protein involved in translation (DUF1610 family)
MSLTRDHDNITFECDDCGETFETDTNDVYAAYQDAKSNGWIAVKTGACWEHQCPDCRGETK